MKKRCLLLYFWLICWNAYGKHYQFGDIFNIDVSEQFELRNDSDAYSQFLDSIGLRSSASAVFQPKGLGEMDTMATTQFCRILIFRASGSQGDFFNLDEKDTIQDNLLKMQQEMRLYCDQEIFPFRYVYGPTFDWVEISPQCYAYKATYVRTGLKGDVMTQLYFLQNSCQAVYVMITYRISISDKWQSELDSAICSFKWVTPYYSPRKDPFKWWLIGLYVVCIGLGVVGLELYFKRQK